MASDGSLEVEIKLRVESAEAARQLLESRGYRVVRERVFEANIMYDTPARDLRSRGELLRLREAGERSILTYKGPSQKAVHKTREELETEIGSAGLMAAIFSRLSFEPVFRYEKYRTEYQQPEGDGLAVLDETPVGVFLELEGPADWIDKAAAELGFAPGDYVTASYGAIYLEYCAKNGIEPKDMVFPQRQP
jgi:adenylate cyclase class 2